MKKAIIIILVLTLAVGSAFCATSKKFSKYGSIFKSGEYTLKGYTYSLDSSGNPDRTDGGALLLAMHAGDYYMEMDAGETSVRIIMSGDTVYMMDDESMMCIVSSEDTDTSAFITDYEYDVIASGNAVLEGKSLYYEKASQNGGTATYWYNGNDLYAISTTTEGSTFSTSSIIIIESLTAAVDESLFTVPDAYEIFDLSSMLGDDYSDLFGDWSYSDSDYDYSSWFSDWNSDDWDYDWDYAEPDFYALGKYYGLSEDQAYEFDTAMNLMSYIDWDSMSSYYNSDTGNYEMSIEDMQNASYLTDYDMELIQKVINAFK